jgi:hypothetical protein
MESRYDKEGIERYGSWSSGTFKTIGYSTFLHERNCVGGAKMKLRVQTILIITKKNDHTLIGLTRQVTEFLLEHSAGKRDPYIMYT